MDVRKAISQLEDLKGHCQDFWDKDDEESIWGDDVEALDMAIDALKKQIQN